MQYSNGSPNARQEGSMYIVTTIPQAQGTIRWVGMVDRDAAVDWAEAIRQDRAMIDGMRADCVRDLPAGRRPAGWERP